jgi:dTDP-4-dehydrorhamnose reductase
MKSYKKKILIIGVNSYIGKSLKNALKKCGHNVFGTSRKLNDNRNMFLDLEDFSGKLFKFSNFDIIVICSAFSKFSQCDKYPERAMKINYQAPIYLSKFFSQKNIRVIYLSTSAVFNAKSSRIRTDHIKVPLSIYGKSKAKAENELLKIKGNNVIIRLSKILNNENNILFDWIDSLKKNKKITACYDHYFCPIIFEKVINFLIKIILGKGLGVYNLSGYNEISYYRAANKIAHALGKSSSLIVSKNAAELGIKPDHITSYTSLDCSRVKKEFMYNQPSAEKVMEDFVKLYT